MSAKPPTWRWRAANASANRDRLSATKSDEDRPEAGDLVWIDLTPTLEEFDRRALLLRTLLAGATLTNRYFD